MTDSSFQLKGSVVTTVLLDIQKFSLDDIIFHLKEKIEQVPHFFNQAPVIVDISKTKENIQLDQFEALIEALNALNLGVIGWRCDPACLPDWKATVTIPLLPASKARAINAESGAKSSDQQDVVVKKVVEERVVSHSSKVITKPIRSGQQVYSEGDLIVLAQVSEGAEVLADGNIHVYGALRGRALAGVKGDKNARIFCKSLEAELVSIAGNFMLSDALQKSIWKDSAQVLLNDENLDVVPL